MLVSHVLVIVLFVFLILGISFAVAFRNEEAFDIESVDPDEENLSERDLP